MEPRQLESLIRWVLGHMLHVASKCNRPSATKTEVSQKIGEAVARHNYKAQLPEHWIIQWIRIGIAESNGPVPLHSVARLTQFWLGDTPYHVPVGLTQGCTEDTTREPVLVPFAAHCSVIDRSHFRQSWLVSIP